MVLSCRLKHSTTFELHTRIWQMLICVWQKRGWFLSSTGTFTPLFIPILSHSPIYSDWKYIVLVNSSSEKAEAAKWEMLNFSLKNLTKHMWSPVKNKGYSIWGLVPFSYFKIQESTGIILQYHNYCTGIKSSSSFRFTYVNNLFTNLFYYL